MGNKIHEIIGAGLICILIGAGCGGGNQPSDLRAWWQKPGLGIQFQIEYRPGMDWDRDYTIFNQSMMDPQGRLNFNGPFPQIDEWVKTSQRVGVDYHTMEIKWHDGICYFNTKLTDWKTETDYACRFAKLSREADIPFMFYYSAIFDHNPQFDSIQPDPHQTFSVILETPQPQYEEYLRGQYREIMEQYHPDGMWIDWWWTDGSTRLTLDFFKTYYPDAVLTFNGSNYIPASSDQVYYTSGEAHGLEGPAVKTVDLGSRTMTVFESAWYWANSNRRLFDHPWELAGPAGKWWQDPSARDDLYELVRMVAVVLACGGKYVVGATSQMDGSIYPNQVRQLEMLGDWYVPRKKLFLGSAAVKYGGDCPPGAGADRDRFNIIAGRLGNDTLIHIINMEGQTGSLILELERQSWAGINHVYLEPTHRKLKVDDSGSTIKINLSPEDVDPVDTIIRIEDFSIS